MNAPVSAADVATELARRILERTLEGYTGQIGVVVHMKRGEIVDHEWPAFERNPALAGRGERG